MDISWHRLFQPHILERGLDYYESGLVQSLEQTGDIYEAIVEGTEDYAVQISVRNGVVEEAYCSCPYAADGNYCKHMAAVLFQIQEGDSAVQHDEPISKPPAERDDLMDIISHIPELTKKLELTQGSMD